MNTLVDKLKIPEYRLRVLLYLIILTIPFSIRHVFSSTWNFQTGAYSDFTSFSIYISDLFILLFVLQSFLIRKAGNPVVKLWKQGGLLCGVWIFLEIIIHKFVPLEIYLSIRLILVIAFAFSISKFTVPREKLAWLFSVLGGLQSLVAIVQFYSQHSLGLYRLGESHLSSTMFGVAKIIYDGTALIRGYGTFPHSNLLSAFLLTTTSLNIYLLTKTSQYINSKYHVIALLGLLYINIFGLFVSFSRGGILALTVSLLIMTMVFLITKQFSLFLKTAVSCGTAIAISLIILLPYLSTRTTISDNSTKERFFYNTIGLAMIRDNPILGQGFGQSVLHMKQYAEKVGQNELKPWEIQPIHNIWLISAADLGFGSLFLIFLMLFPIFLVFKRVIKKPDLWNLTLLSISIGYIFLFFLDHYFYTIWPTQVLLWLIIGLSANSNQEVPRGTQTGH